MKLKDILPNHPIGQIEVRTNDPWGEDMLFGYCAWTGNELISLDGDTYSIEEEITNYMWDAHDLVYWFRSEWK